MEENSENSEKIPELKAGLLSSYTLHWLNFYFDLGSKITDENIPHPIDERNIEIIYSELDQNWQSQVEQNVPSIGTV